MPFRFSRRKSFGNSWVGLGKTGPSVGRRGKRVSVSMGSRGPRISVRLTKGLGWFKQF